MLRVMTVISTLAFPVCACAAGAATVSMAITAVRKRVRGDTGSSLLGKRQHASSGARSPGRRRRASRGLVRLVALPHCLLEAGLGGAALELVALRRVPRDAVEEDAERLRGV